MLLIIHEQLQWDVYVLLLIADFVIDSLSWKYVSIKAAHGLNSPWNEVK